MLLIERAYGDQEPRWDLVYEVVALLEAKLAKGRSTPPYGLFFSNLNKDLVCKLKNLTKKEKEEVRLFLNHKAYSTELKDKACQ